MSTYIHNLKNWQMDTAGAPICWFRFKMPAMAKGLKQGVRNSIYISHMGSRSPIT